MKRLHLIFILAILGSACLAQTQQHKPSDFQTRRTQALTLFDLGRQTEALPLFEALVKEKPDDVVLLERYGMCLLMNSATMQDPDQRKKMRVQARQELLRSRELGNTSQISELANDIPADGSFPTYSSRQDVESVMEAGEAAFAKGDYDIAIDNYKKALALDPRNYFAALYIGDMYFRKSDAENAGVWFEQAIAIDPNIETAYRYWGDALMQQKKYEQAKSKFLDAVVAEPYKRNSWIGLFNWAQARGMKLVKPNIVPPNKVEENAKGATITVDPKSFGSEKNQDADPVVSAWLVYPMIHLNWKNEGKFRKHYPDEKAYRHSLAEELDAFTTVLKIYDELTAKKPPKQVDAQIAKLRELRGRGFLEAYILIHRADRGIAQDYPAYRDSHRERLRDYVEYCVVPNTEAN